MQRWKNTLGFFIENKLVVLILVALLLGAGVYTSPFAWETGGFPRDRVPVDAIPNVGENQQIVFTEWPGRSPRDVEDQVTYPLTTALLGIPGVQTVRSSSMFGVSSIYVIFEDGIDFYWSRSRVLEKLAALSPGLLPEGVSPQLGPDATALGQVFWYQLEGRSPDGELVGGWGLHELRSIQDWTVRYALQSVPGVAEVASIGGFVREYHVDVNPDALKAHDVTLNQVAAAVRKSNLDVGARTLEINRVEYIVRGLGFVESREDLEQTVVATRDHTPIRVADVARVGFGPAQRRGALDDAGAETVGGVVVTRYGANPMAVIQQVKEKIRQIQPGLPTRALADGTQSQVTIRSFYDRTELIDATLATLSTALLQQILVTVIVVLVILRNLRTSLLISAILPLAVLGTFVAMKYAGVDANIMALAGIAIAIGTMVDIAIVFVENIVKHLDEAPADVRRSRVVRDAAAEVAPAVLTSVATTVISFVPVFGLTGQAGKLFSPLAYTKTFAMVLALLTALVVLPALAHLLLRGAKATPARVDRRDWRAIARAVFRPIHLPYWALLIAGGIAVVWIGWVGLVLSALALMWLIGPLLPARFGRWMPVAEVALAAGSVTVLLARDWRPLGAGAGMPAQLLFVVALLGFILLSFAAFHRAYPAILRWSLDHKLTALMGPLVIVLLGTTAWLGVDGLFGWLPRSVRTSAPVAAVAQTFPGFGREDMPPFDEGAFLYMPTTMPHASIGQALDLMKQMDAAIAQIPEVDRVVGKLGRADSPLDPAPVSMFETIITYKDEHRITEDGKRVRQWRDHIQSPDDIWQEITQAADLPGITGAPVLMPIKTRIVMLQSGMRAPMGLRVSGPDLETVQAFGLRLEKLLREVPSIDADTAQADRIVGKPYVEIDIDREAIGRYGLAVADVQEVIQIALGGKTLTRSVEGRERYPIRVRYMREERDSIRALGEVLVPTPAGQHVPLGQLAHIRYVKGPKVIKSEDTFLVGYVTFDARRDEQGDAIASEGEVVEQARSYIRDAIDSGRLRVPDGVSFEFAGSYQNMLETNRRLTVLIPLALAVIFLLLYLQFRRVSTTAIIYSGVVLSVASGMLLIWLYGRGWFLSFSVLGADMQTLFQVETVNMSVAVWVGIIALVGIATDNGVVLATHLDQRFLQSPPQTPQSVRQRAFEAGMRRLRPCLMTTATTVIALLPVITSQGRGSDIMVRMALPVVGGMVGALLTLFVVPVLYAAAAEWRLRHSRTPPPAAAA